ncbi:MFS transporter [Arthrobacter sp. NPDC058097]|uniref:MFS transporter n=1 Tax=Arthrobacter sp. NPDC058097 TaxID=3346340 RepID=UPI0036DB9970
MGRGATQKESSARAGLWLCLGAGFITLLDQSVFVLAVPAMTAGLGADPAQVQWILASYSLAFGVALVPAGRLGDVLGRRALFIAGIMVFGAFSLVGGLASDPALVIVARLLQGLGAGTLNPQVLGLLQDLFSGTRRAKALGYYAAAGGFAAVCGPLAGGLILSAAGDSAGWRVLFLMNVPLVVLLVPLAFRFLPARPGRDHSARSASVDGVGALLLGAVVVAFLVPTVYGTPDSTPAWLAGGAAVLLCFAGWELLYHRRGRTPLLSAGLARSTGYVLGTVVALCQFGVGAAMSAVTAFYFLSGSGLPPLAAAGILAPQAAGMLLASGSSWRFVARFGRAGIVFALAASLGTLIAKDVAVQHLDHSAGALAVAAIGLLQGVATGLVVAPNQALTLGHAPAGTAGVAAGFYQLSQRFSAALCSAAVAGLFLHAGSGFAGVTRSVAADGGYRAAFHHGILLCSALTAAAIAAGSLDWIRTAVVRRRNRNGVGGAGAGWTRGGPGAGELPLDGRLLNLSRFLNVRRQPRAGKPRRRAVPGTRRRHALHGSSPAA